MSIQHKYVNRCIIKLLNEKHIGQVVRIGGWQKTSRLQGGGRFLFIELNDGSCLSNLQVVVDDNVTGFAEASKSLAGSSFMIEGEVKKSITKGQVVELHAKNVELLGGSDEKYPIGKGKVKVETLRDICHLDQELI